MSKTLNAEEFVEAYMKAYADRKSIGEFCKSIDANYNAVYFRIRRYRDLGIKLPTLVRKSHLSGISLDVNKLKKIVKDGR